MGRSGYVFSKTVLSPNGKYSQFVDCPTLKVLPSCFASLCLQTEKKISLESVQFRINKNGLQFLSRFAAWLVLQLFSFSQVSFGELADV